MGLEGILCRCQVCNQPWLISAMANNFQLRNVPKWAKTMVTKDTMKKPSTSKATKSFRSEALLLRTVSLLYVSLVKLQSCGHVSLWHIRSGFIFDTRFNKS